MSNSDCKTLSDTWFTLSGGININFKLKGVYPSFNNKNCCKRLGKTAEVKDRLQKGLKIVECLDNRIVAQYINILILVG
jgi:hypothetical protein